MEESGAYLPSALHTCPLHLIRSLWPIAPFSCISSCSARLCPVLWEALLPSVLPPAAPSILKLPVHEGCGWEPLLCSTVYNSHNRHNPQPCATRNHVFWRGGRPPRLQSRLDVSDFLGFSVPANCCGLPSHSYNFVPDCPSNTSDLRFTQFPEILPGLNAPSLSEGLRWGTEA